MSKVRTIVEYLRTLPVVKGGSTFAGNSSARTIAHGLGATPTYVTITPSIGTSAGYVGEIWYTADATNLNVYNSGSATTAFTWAAS